MACLASGKLLCAGMRGDLVLASPEAARCSGVLPPPCFALSGVAARGADVILRVPPFEVPVETAMLRADWRGVRGSRRE